MYIKINSLHINVLLVITDLQFKIIMSQKNQQQQSEKRSASTNSHRSRKDESRSRGAGGIDKGTISIFKLSYSFRDFYLKLSHTN